jgi:type 1 glutamine amidotransferase
MEKDYFKKVFCLSFFLFTALFLQGQKTLLTFAVFSGDFDRQNTPVSISLEGTGLSTTSTNFQLVEIRKNEESPTPFQLDKNSIYWLLSGDTPSGSSRLFELRTTEQSNQEKPAELVAKQNDKSILFQQFGKNILQYQFAEAQVPDGVSQLFRRGGFIHPLWSPKGEVLTRIQPPDHYHHYGIWNPWTSTTFEGRHLDFWNLYKGQGTVKPATRPTFQSGPVFGEFATRHEHVDLTAPDPTGAKVALNEEWKVRIWGTNEVDAPRLIDFQSTLQCATDSIFTINAYRYQGFSLRATEKWNDETARLLTSEQKDKSNGNGTRARWCDVSGISDFGNSGILFMTHPQNYNFPEQLRIWPVGTNKGKENVYFNFNPAQEQDWVLFPNKYYTLNYRMLVYDGELNAETMEKYWQDYAHPPKVEIILNQLKISSKKVLVYTKNGKGYVHKNIPTTVKALKKLGATHGFVVEATDDPSIMTDEKLKQYHALIFSNTNNETFDTDAQRLAFQRYIQAGGGFVGIHSASGSERQWPWFAKTLGGKFRRHPPIQEFNIEIIDPNHPSTIHLPKIWKWEDECYYLNHLNPKVRVLMTAQLNTIEDEKMDEYPGKTFGNQFPLSWCRATSRGRIWYTALGHKKEYYADPDFLQHLLGGIFWVLDGTDRLDYAKATKSLIIE